MATTRPKAARGVVPSDPNDKKAPADTAWSAPSLADFTDESWDKLTDDKKKEIAGCYTWAKAMPPAAFGDLKLPHHRASDYAVVLKGVEAAAARLDQSDIPSADLDKVKAHLAAEYKKFDKKAPWEDQKGDKAAAPAAATRVPPFAKPKPEEISRLREAFPKGSPRFSYREMTLRVERDPDPAMGGGDAALDADGDDDQAACPQCGVMNDAGEETCSACGGEMPRSGGHGAAARATSAAPDDRVPIAISSEQPVLRYDWWADEIYYEVLDHAPGSVDLSYARDGLPFVASHRSYDADQQHGLVEDVAVSPDRTLRGKVRFSKAQRSQEIAQDMKDGIRKKVSVGYIVGDDYTQEAGSANGIPTRRYTAWMPLETSTVPVPADYDVGVGRAMAASGQSALARFLELHPARSTSPTSSTESPQSRSAVRPPSSPAPKAEEHRMSEATNAATASGTEAAIAAAVTTSRATEADRIKYLREMGTTHAVPSDKLEAWIREGASVEAAARETNDILAKRIKDGPQRTEVELPTDHHKRFNFVRAMLANTEMMHEGDFRRVDFGYERELLTGIRGQQQIGLTKGGNLIPYRSVGQRAGIDSGTSTTGAPFKFTQPGEFIPVLRNKTSVMRAGATVLDGLTGPVTFPKQTAAAGTVWSAENPGSDISFTNLTTSTVTLSFKSVGAGTAFSRQMLFSAASGNYAIESLIESDILAVLGLAIDLAALNGSGASNQPKGILQNTAIGSHTLGTNGGTMAWADWTALEQLIGDANADGARMAYITNTKQRNTAKTTSVLGNTAVGVPIWTGPAPITGGVQGLQPDQQFAMDGVVNGYRAIASNQVPRNLTKGTSTTICSAILFGAFEHLLIGMFGNGIETVVDPYSKKFQGMVEIAAWAFMDVNDRYDGAFASVQDAL